MAYVYICDKCFEGDHAHCEHSKGQDYGVGICICSHFENAKSAFEKERWEMKRNERAQED